MPASPEPSASSLGPILDALPADILARYEEWTEEEFARRGLTPGTSTFEQREEASQAVAHRIGDAVQAGEEWAVVLGKALVLNMKAIETVLTHGVPALAQQFRADGHPVEKATAMAREFAQLAQHVHDH